MAREVKLRSVILVITIYIFNVVCIIITMFHIVLWKRNKYGFQFLLL